MQKSLEVALVDKSSPYWLSRPFIPSGNPVRTGVGPPCPLRDRAGLDQSPHLVAPRSSRVTFLSLKPGSMKPFTFDPSSMRSAWGGSSAWPTKLFTIWSPRIFLSPVSISPSVPFSHMKLPLSERRHIPLFHASVICWYDALPCSTFTSGPRGKLLFSLLRSNSSIFFFLPFIPL